MKAIGLARAPFLIMSGSANPVLAEEVAQQLDTQLCQVTLKRFADGEIFVKILPGAVNAVILLVLAGMLFVRVGYLYPSRTPVWRTTSIALGIVWGVILAGVIWLLPAPPGWLVVASLFYPVYYFGLSFVLQGRRTGATALSAAALLAAGVTGAVGIVEGAVLAAGGPVRQAPFDRLRESRVRREAQGIPSESRGEGPRLGLLREIVGQTPAVPPARVARTFALPPGTPVVIETTIGEITIAAWPRSEVDVQIDRKAERGADLTRPGRAGTSRPCR